MKNWKHSYFYYRSIYLGETFSCYICVHNDSNDVVSGVILKVILIHSWTTNFLLSTVFVIIFYWQVDLQTTTQRLTLIREKKVDALKLKETLDEVIHHEVKEIGTHM